VTEHCGGVSPLQNERRDDQNAALRKEGWWWYIWTSWHLIREVLRMSSLKEGTEGVVGN
jgi:negative regulator of sigma E activity